MSEELVERVDVLVVGSGVAGASAAFVLADAGVTVGVATKDGAGESTTKVAQGGIAAVVAPEDDTFELHLADTLNAGAGLCDEDAARVLVNEGPRAIQLLEELGARFDRTSSGTLLLAREGAHSAARVVHAGGAATGAEVVRVLVGGLQSRAVSVHPNCFVESLVLTDGRCTGARGRDGSGRTVVFEAAAVLLATGGLGELFELSTNPPGATGDSIALALGAGVVIADVEFVQFHPTALAVPVHPRPLLTEALRGEGAVLRDERGKRFVDELAPRDVVSRAIASVLSSEGTDAVFLDATSIGDFARRFPSITQILAAVGLDPARDLLPVAPAAHYVSGGILTDLEGRSSVPGLFAVGEAACSGVHGANRLASNSLLEGVVFGSRAARAIASGALEPTPSGALSGCGPRGSARTIPVVDLELEPLPDHVVAVSNLRTARANLQKAMTEYAGVVRDASSLRAAGRAISSARAAASSAPHGRERGELEHLCAVGEVLVGAALARRESRGAHTRADFPGRDDDHLRVRLAPRRRLRSPRNERIEIEKEQERR